MGKITFDYLGNPNLLENSQSNDLSVLIGTDRFSFLIAGPQQNILALKSFQYQKAISREYKLSSGITEICRTEPMLTQSYREVKIGLHNQSSTLVPDDLYKADNNRNYLEKLMEVPPVNEIKIDSITSLSLKNIFTFPGEIGSILKGFFPSSRIFHGNSPLLFAFQKLASIHKGVQAYINVHGNLLQVFVFDNGKLLFNNTFSYQTPNDFIYFVLLPYHQFNLKPETVPVSISGFLVDDSKLFHILFRYIRHLNWVQVPDFYNVPEDIKTNNPHFYYDLFSLKLCE